MRLHHGVTQIVRPATGEEWAHAFPAQRTN
jgi:hypothetical protein